MQLWFSLGSSLTSVVKHLISESVGAAGDQFESLRSHLSWNTWNQLTSSPVMENEIETQHSVVSVIYSSIPHSRFFLKEQWAVGFSHWSYFTCGVFTGAADARRCSCSLTVIHRNNVFGIINEFRNTLCGRALSAGSTLEMFSREELTILYVVCPSRVAVPVCPVCSYFQRSPVRDEVGPSRLLCAHCRKPNVVFIALMVLFVWFVCTSSGECGAGDPLWSD